MHDQDGMEEDLDQLVENELEEVLDQLLNCQDVDDVQMDLHVVEHL